MKKDLLRRMLALFVALLLAVPALASAEAPADATEEDIAITAVDSEVGEQEQDLADGGDDALEAAPSGESLPEKEQSEEAQPEAEQSEEEQSEEAQPEAEQPEKEQSEEAQSEEGQSEEGQPEEGQPEEGQSEEAQSEEGQSEEKQPEEGQSEEAPPEEGQSGEEQLYAEQPVAEQIDVTLDDAALGLFDLPGDGDEVFVYEASDALASDRYATDDDALLDAYIQRMFDATLSSHPEQLFEPKATARERLDAAEGAIYDCMAAEICKIAAGTRDNTVIEIPNSALEYNLARWSAADLGVDKIIDNEGNITNETKVAVKNKLNALIGKVLKALLADYPCELYWFNKVTGLKYSYTISCTSTAATIRNLIITMPVSVNYAGSGENTVDTTGVERAELAIQNAQAIVNNSSGTMLERITGYKNAICAAVSYDDEAVEGTGKPYGDPWQLVYAFDEDETTNIVCEGYSKAFKYLFDLSDFGEPYDCLLILGGIPGGHMWNLVHMDDGRNYLVDVTNCDAGTVGAPDKLFMAYGPSGSVAQGYTFKLSSSYSIKYTYDSGSRITFDDAQLKVSAAKYGSWTVSVAPGITGGSVTPSLTVSEPGKPVSLSAVPNAGWKLKSVSASYHDASGAHAIALGAGNTFVMPAADVTAYATFEQLATDPVPGGSVAPPAPVAPVVQTISATANRSYPTVDAAPGAVFQLDLGGAQGKQFKSSKKKVAVVNGSGQVTIRGAGKTKITFKVGGKKRTVTLKVNDITVPRSISLNMSGVIPVKKGSSVTLTAALPANTNSAVKWKSSNKKVARVVNGVVRFRKAGRVTITATAVRGKKKAKVTFIVTP